MKEDRLKYLLERYAIDACTEAERAELSDWFHAYNPGRKELDNWLGESGGPGELSVSLYKDFTRRNITPKTQMKSRRVFPYTAAAVIAVVFFFLYPGKKAVRQTKEPASLARITPPVIPIRAGGNKAILTLADGSTISLNDSNKGSIAVQNNTRIVQVHGDKIAYKASAGHSPGDGLVYNRLSTPRGGKFSVTLADGSLVTLDASSSITYPVAFGKDERRVEVTGQVFFEVVHHAQQPFRVIVKGQTIEDIGTSFNVKAYDDEPIVKITLAGGKVNISNAAGSATLVPGQQAGIEDGQKNIRVKSVNVDETIAWKNGWFVFHHETIENVMKQAGRWYDVDVVYERGPVHKEFGGTISKYKEISELLENLKLAGGIHYRIEGRKIIFF